MLILIVILTFSFWGDEDEHDDEEELPNVVRLPPNPIRVNPTQSNPIKP
jgi:hypothetical protein